MYLTLESTERPVLSAKAKKIVGSRPVYKLSMKDKTGKKITWLKKGKVIIEVRYKPSKREEKTICCLPDQSKRKCEKDCDCAQQYKDKKN